VSCRIVGIREGLSRQQERKKKEAEVFNAAFYRCSPRPGSIFDVDETLTL